MYGETLAKQRLSLVGKGLSPHVRGNLRKRVKEQQETRSIPACTGKPHRPTGRVPYPRVYPRMYGETCATNPMSSLVVGLSPHVRGNPMLHRFDPPDEGSIPACTGKPSHHPEHHERFEVYPRMYGETDE